MLGHTHILIQQQTDEVCVSTPDQNRLGGLVGASERMRQLYGLPSSGSHTSDGADHGGIGRRQRAGSQNTP